MRTVVTIINVLLILLTLAAAFWVADGTIENGKLYFAKPLTGIMFCVYIICSILGI